MIGYLILTAILLADVFELSQSSNVDIECVLLRDCPELLKLVKENPSSQETLKLLRTSHCGLDGRQPKVWCTQVPSNCKTPNEQPGRCVPIKACEPFLQIIKSGNDLSTEIKSYLRKFECQDFDPIKTHLTVCCPKNKDDIIRKPHVNRPNLLPRPAEGGCGRNLINKIVGGKETQMDEFPWTARLQYQFGNSFITACGGSLINNKYVITAAHCVDDIAIRRVGKLINVILGDFDTRNKTDCINVLGIRYCADPPLIVPVQQIIVHSEWYTRPSANLNHDIALVRLSVAVRFTDYIHSICLPSSTLTVTENERLVVTGWGQTERAAESFVKLKTTVPVANRNRCVQRYKQEKRLTVGEGEICVGGVEGKDSCSGDSGGPLMLLVNRNGTGYWFLVGIVSFGPNQPCGIKDFPGLYTYLPKYLNWIYENIQP